MPPDKPLVSYKNVNDRFLYLYRLLKQEPSDGYLDSRELVSYMVTMMAALRRALRGVGRNPRTGRKREVERASFQSDQDKFTGI